MPVSTDLTLGGRWTSLVLDGRDWLWRRDDQARPGVRPGDAFVDAGGLEECLPTVRGVPDHGDVWSRPWRKIDEHTAAVETDDFHLVRRFGEVAGGVSATYVLTADPGYRFVWAGHALLEVSEQAELSLPAGVPVRLFPEAAPYVEVPWPSGAEYLTATWPECAGVPLHRLGAADGSAIGAIALCNAARVTDGADSLTFQLTAAGVPCSIAVWRNLGGFPEGAPYRSIGVEPMLGSVFDLAAARGPRDAVVVPGSGLVEWELTCTSSSR